MGKNQQKLTHKTHINKPQSKKILWVMLILTSIFCVNLVSAAWGDLDDDLLAWWSFDVDASDVTGNGYDGILQNAPTNEAGKLGNGYTFVGASKQAINVTHDGAWNFQNRNFTIAFWANVSTYANDGLVTHSDMATSDGFRIMTFTNKFDYQHDSPPESNVIPVDTFTTNVWNHIVVVKNATHTAMWVNGTYQADITNSEMDDATTPLAFGVRWFFAGSQYLDGSLDEIGIWNRSLSDSEIGDLWNSGAGLAYREIDLFKLTITLTSPIDGFVSSESGLNFTGNYTITNANLTNATYYIWDSTGAIFNDTETVLVNGTVNGSTHEINNFTLETYTWNIFVCGENSTQATCDWAENNYTLNIGVTINNETHKTNVWETANERFELNISLIPGANLYLADLYYNGTRYTGNILNLGSDKYSIYKNIDIPYISGANDNFSFFWRLTYEKADGTFLFQNLTTYTQAVYQIQLGNCAGALTNITLNFTSWDEEKLTRIAEGFDFKATFFYWLGGGTTMKNVSFNNAGIHEKVICINPANVTYYLINSDIEYQANESGYVTRNYYFENHTINNVTQNISLYLLNSSDSTSFILKVVNQNQQNVEDAFIHTQRYYPGTGKYETIQIAKTDENGKSIGFFKTETVDYRFLIKRNSVVELVTSKQKVIPEETPYTLTFTIGVSIETPWADFEDLEDLEYNLYHNSTTNITYFTYIDTSDTFTLGRLLVKEIKHNQTDTIVCNKTSTSSSATLTCDLSSHSGTFVAYGLITRSGTEKTISIVWAVITTVVEIIGLAGLFLSFFIILVAGCSFLWHPIAGIIGINFAVIMVNIMGLVSWSSLFIFGMISISIILIFIIKD